MKIENKLISFLLEVLSKAELDLEKSSARRRFIRLFIGFKEDYTAEIKSITKKYCDKDEKGIPKIDKDHYVFTNKENEKKAIEEIKNLDNLIIEVSKDGHEKDFATIKEVIEDIVKDFKVKNEKEKGGKINAFDFDYIETLSEISELLS